MRFCVICCFVIAFVHPCFSVQWNSSYCDFKSLNYGCVQCSLERRNHLRDRDKNHAIPMEPHLVEAFRYTNSFNVSTNEENVDGIAFVITQPDEPQWLTGYFIQINMEEDRITGRRSNKLRYRLYVNFDNLGANDKPIKVNVPLTEMFQIMGEVRPRVWLNRSLGLTVCSMPERGISEKGNCFEPLLYPNPTVDLEGFENFSGEVSESCVSESRITKTPEEPSLSIYLIIAVTALLIFGAALLFAATVCFKRTSDIKEVGSMVRGMIKKRKQESHRTLETNDIFDIKHDCISAKWSSGMDIHRHLGVALRCDSDAEISTVRDGVFSPGLRSIGSQSTTTGPIDAIDYDYSIPENYEFGFYFNNTR
ncbi:uncharacterized protein LOC142344259 isoform X2 [Convolutriloba macropyga]|uniref:uncharacterized protein LOC142344259 isoform X2 n=1 Tax=Convolutriloba macropyga TaxID=536237 RepID=UPI003F525892